MMDYHVQAFKAAWTAHNELRLNYAMMLRERARDRRFRGDVTGAEEDEREALALELGDVAAKEGE